MGKNSTIEWTTHTWNPWQGCHKVSDGCKNCYMFREKKRWGQNPNVVVRSKDATFDKPLHWKEQAMVFTCSWSDFFIEEADEWRENAWNIIRRTPHLTYQILTKRPENIESRLPDDWGNGWDNVWLGVTVESQEYGYRVDELLDIPARLHFVSYEPGLGPLDLTFYPCIDCQGLGYHNVVNRFSGANSHVMCGACNGTGIEIDWLIVGGESERGREKARPFHLEWIENLIEQCRYGPGPKIFVKQLGTNPYYQGKPYLVTGKGDGVNEWPEHLRVREFPNAIQ